MPHSLVVSTFDFAITQSSVLPLRALMNPDAYAIYATLLPRASNQRDGVILLVPEILHDPLDRAVVGSSTGRDHHAIRAAKSGV